MYAEFHYDLVAMGYDIIPVHRDGKAPIPSDWSNYTKRKMLKAAKRWPDESIGLLTSKNPCIDVDCLSPALAGMMVRYLRPLFPDSLERVGRAPKTLFICRTDTPFSKMASKIYIDSEGLKNQVEFLGKGQQAVIWGNHATTKRPYTYIGDEIHDVWPSELDELTPEMAQDIIAQFERFAEGLGMTEQVKALKTTQSDDTPEGENWGLGLANEDERAAIVDALASLDADVHHDDWIQVGMAIHNAYSGSEEGFTLWADWSDSSGNPDHHGCDYGARWRSFRDDNGRGNIGFPTLLKMARDAGWEGHSGIEDTIIETDEAFDEPKEFVSGGFLSMLAEHTLTHDEINQFADPRWLVENLVIKGQLSAYPAPPNGGKTLLFMELARELAEDHTVVYINMDIAGSGSKRHWTQAKESGVEWVTPDLKNTNINHLMSSLYSAHVGDLKNTVIIIDTLKKLTDMIDKRKSKALYKNLRKLTSKGATVICLCHTNKYKDSDGNYIYEGTGDLRSDVDNLIYLEPFHEGSNLRTLSTRPDKTRGAFEPITFEFDDNRRMKVADEFIDANTMVQESADKEGIDEVNQALRAGCLKQAEIVDYVKEHHGRNAKRVRRILTSYGGEFAKVKQIWDMRRMDKVHGRPVVYSFPESF